MKYKLILNLALFLVPHFIIAQPDGDIDSLPVEKPKPTLFQTFSSETDIPKIVLTTNLKKVLKNKFNAEKVDANLSITNGEKIEQWNIRIEARGKSRRRICNFPPLKLTFYKADLKEKGIRKKFNSLKLVSYCKNQKKYEDYVRREYAAYKLYNILTDYSFRVQLVEVEYRDSSNKIKPIIRYGILLENTDEMAKRLNAKEKSKYEFKRDSLDHFQYDLLTMYQYMIGNTDWKIRALHNIKIIRDSDSKKYYPIPYDFDYSGLVNATYAIPNPDYNLTHVQERAFLGECRSAEELTRVRELFLQKKDEILDCNKEIFSEKEYKYLKKYIYSFYSIIESDKKFKKRCLKRSRN